MSIWPEEYPISYNIAPHVIESACEFMNQNSFEDSMSIAKELAKVGIYFEYNWPGHREEWILATRSDAYDFEDAILSWRD